MPVAAHGVQGRVPKVDELPCGSWELNVEPQKEQQVLLAAEPSPQAQEVSSLCCLSSLSYFSSLFIFVMLGFEPSLTHARPAFYRWTTTPVPKFYFRVRKFSLYNWKKMIKVFHFERELKRATEY